MNRTILLSALLLSTACAIPLAAADGTTDIVTFQPPAGVTLYPLCVWWSTSGWYVYTPGATVNAPPAHATIDPVYVGYVPPTHGEVCVGSIYRVGTILQIDRALADQISVVGVDTDVLA